MKVASSWPPKLWMTRTKVGKIRHEVVVTKFNALSRHLLWEYEKHQPGFKQDALEYTYEALPQRMLGILILFPHPHELVFT
jgi:hypothetical protein